MRGRQPGEVGGGGAERGCDVDADAEAFEEFGDLGHIVAVAEAEAGGAEEIAGERLSPLGGAGEVADQLEEGLGGAEALLALVGGQLERDDRHRQAHALGEPARIVLDQFGGAGGADDHRLRLEALVGLAAGGLEELGGVGAEVAGLEGGVGHRRAVVAPLDHREQQVGIGVALGRVQDVVQALHAGGDAQRAHMRRAFVGPDRELHTRTAFRRRIGRENRPARSPACS